MSEKRTLFELIDKDLLAEIAKQLWPDQEQDPDRTGAGWDVQVAGVK